MERGKFGLVGQDSDDTIYWGLELDGGNVDLYYVDEDGERIYVVRINAETGQLDRFEGAPSASFLDEHDDGTIFIGKDI